MTGPSDEPATAHDRLDLGQPPWEIPPQFRETVANMPGSADWLPSLRDTAARYAECWGVGPDGPAMYGWTSMAWPVIDATGRRYVLKVTPPVSWIGGEAAALSAWARNDHRTGVPRMIIPAAVAPDDRVILLPRLDPSRSLEDHPDTDEAIDIIAQILVGIAGTPPAPGALTLVDELDRIEEGFSVDGPVPADQVDRARRRLVDLRSHLTTTPQSLLHNDLHFSNVLRSRSEDEPAWFGIDPLPVIGIGEWEPIPMLRNRWPAAAASGDPDRSLRRRVDQVCEVTGYDPELVRCCAQIVAVANLHWLLPDRRDHLHAPAYLLMAGW